MALATATMLLDGGARVLVTGRSQAGVDSAKKELGEDALVTAGCQVERKCHLTPGVFSPAREVQRRKRLRLKGQDPRKRRKPKNSEGTRGRRAPLPSSTLLRKASSGGAKLMFGLA